MRQDVVIGVAAAACAFLLLCVGALLCYLARRTKKHRGPMFQTASKPPRIEPGRLPTITTVVTSVNEADGHADVSAYDYPTSPHNSGRTCSSMLSPASGAVSPAGPNRRDVVISRLPDTIEEDVDGDEIPRVRSPSFTSLSERIYKRDDYNALDVRDRPNDAAVMRQTLTPTLNAMPSLLEPVADAPYGQIQFQLEFNQSSCAVRVRLIKAMSLPGRDSSGAPDPYVKVMLVNPSEITYTGKVLDMVATCKTEPVHKTLNPVFEECFDLPCPPSMSIHQLGLLLYVYDADRFSKSDPIGHTWLSLNSIDLTGKPTFWRALEPTKTVDVDKAGLRLGQIHLALAYDRQTCKLTVSVHGLRDLAKFGSGKSPEPFYRVRLIHNKCRWDKRDIHPGKNDQPADKVRRAIHFTLSESTPVEECAILVAVCYYEKINTQPLGIVNVGADLPGEKVDSDHWRSMLSGNAQLIYQWHSLQHHSRALQFNSKKKYLGKSPR